MKRDQSGTFLSAVFVDYDNIYLSLRRKSEEAARRFAKDAAVWIKEIETGSLITPTNGPGSDGVRRIVMNRCYGNPVPRRSTTDNSTDMNSFPFVRHHFLRAGFEIVDCPPLTAQLKNSSDIRMVMDVRDYLTHATYFDEFVILSGDADFTPVLHRLRAHARRTVIFANDYTAAPYTAISDGEVREADLITLLIEGRLGDKAAASLAAQPDAAALDAIRRDIIADVVAAVRSANAPVPLEVLADRAIRAVGHDKAIGTGWAGAGGFRDLLAQVLPEGLRLSGEPPYVVIDVKRHITVQPQPLAAADLVETRSERIIAAPQPVVPQAAAPAPLPAAAAHPQPQPVPREIPAPRSLAVPASMVMPQAAAPQQSYAPAAPVHQPAAVAPRSVDATSPSAIQQSIARIHEACQAPPLAPPEYRVLFEVMAQEITDNGLIGAQTIANIVQRAQERGIDVRRDDARFALEVVSEADPWFEQGATANLFAGRFRNFVVARCRGQGLNLSADELDLVEAWFAGTAAVAPQPARPQPQPQPLQPAPLPPQHQPQPQPSLARAPAPAADPRQSFWSLEEGRQHVAEHRQPVRPPAPAQVEPASDDFPRIVRTRLRG